MSLLALSLAQLFGVVFVAVGGLTVAVTGRYVWRATGVWRADAVDSLAGVAPGTLVCVSGSIQQGSGDTLTAPFSGTDCRVLRYQIEEHHLSPAVLPWYVTLHETARSVPFGLRTPATEIDVLAATRTVTLERRVVATVPMDEGSPDRIERFERGNDAVSTTRWRSPPAFVRPLARALSLGTRRYTEERAGSGDAVTVVGRVTDDGDAIDPTVVSDRQPRGIALRMVKPVLVGLASGVSGIAFGLLFFFAG